MTPEVRGALDGGGGALCGCGATWTGKRIEHCSAPGCHQTFTGTRAGDKHRTGDYFPDTRRCLSAEEMVEAGFRRNRHGHWTFGAPDPRWNGDSESRVVPENAQERPEVVAEGPESSGAQIGAQGSGCYICRPDDPNAAEEGCQDCDREFWEYASHIAVALCDHDWMLRPESDTHECLICGAER